MKTEKTEITPGTTVIIGPELKAAIRIAAKKDKRSMSSFIEVVMAKHIKFKPTQETE